MLIGSRVTVFEGTLTDSLVTRVSLPALSGRGEEPQPIKQGIVSSPLLRFWRSLRKGIGKTKVGFRSFLTERRTGLPVRVGLDLIGTSVLGRRSLGTKVSHIVRTPPS